MIFGSRLGKAQPPVFARFARCALRLPRVLGSALLLLFAQDAWGADEELVLAFEPAYALTNGAADQHGAGGHLTLAYGITDSFWLTASGGATHHFARGDIESRTLFEGFGGLTAALDVLRIIPFLEVLIGVAAGPKNEGGTKIDPTVRLGAGFDVLLSPSFSLGAVFRYRPVSDDLGDAYLTADLRLAWRIEL
jgi:hypothetical protein